MADLQSMPLVNPADGSLIDDTSVSPDAKGFLNAEINAKSYAWGIGQEMPWVINLIQQAFVACFGVLIRLTTRAVTEVLSAVNELLEQDNPELGRLAASILGTLFGQEVSAAIPGGILNPGNLQDTAGAVGHAVLGAVFGSIDMTGGGGLSPGLDRAEQYLGAVTEMTVRGFLLDVLEEMVPHWHLQFVHNLEEELIAGLGLGRVARTVLHPIVTTLIADPALWALNLAYRPKLASPEIAIAMWRRQTIGDGELDDILGRQGYGADHIEALKIAHLKHLAVGELDTLNRHGVISDGDAVAALELQNYDEQTATEVWEATKFRRMDPWLIREVDVWMGKLESGLITIEQFRNDLRSIGLSDDVAQLVMNIAGARVETPRLQLSVGELITAWENNIITQNDVHDRLVARGYSEDDAGVLLLTRIAIGQHKHEVEQLRLAAKAARDAALAQAKADRAAAAAQKAAQAAAERAKKAAVLAQQKAQAAADAETRRQLVVTQAEAKRQLVAHQHAAGQLTADQLAVANAQIASDAAALIAHIDGQIAAETAAFERQKLDLQTANREADLHEALANVDISAQASAQLRQQAVQLKIAANDQLLQEKLDDIDTLYADRLQIIQADLENAAAAVDVSVVPAGSERANSSATKIALLDDKLERQLIDIDAQYDEKQAAADREHGDGTITDKTYETRSDAIQNSRDQAKRAAQQSHDLGVQALGAAGGSSGPTSVDVAGKAKESLQTKAQAAGNKLAGDKVASQLSAHQSHDKTALDLAVIQQQLGPITAAEAARRKLVLNQADDAAKRDDQVKQASIARAAIAAAEQIAKVQATADAAHKRLQVLQSTTTAREAATTANLSAQASLVASQEAAREQLERTIAAHQPQVSAPTSPAAAA